MPFTSSIRALRADREWPALLILITASLLLGLWLLWFLWAPLARYEYGDVIGVTPSGALIAAFPPQAQADLHTGQVALVRQADSTPGAKAAPPAPALVQAVQPTQNAEQAVAQLVPLTARWFGGSQAGETPPASLSVQVEVERLSPAQWIWRASGQWIDRASVVLWPQAR